MKTLRGRFFSESDIEIIKCCVEEGFERGRTYISRAVCERLNWRQPNGWLKDRACREVLIKLENEGIIRLPPSRAMKSSQKQNIIKVISKKDHLGKFDVTTPLENFPGNVNLIFAKGNEEEKLWNLLVDKYHYLGHRVAVGRHIKYLIMAENTLLGALGFSSPSWHLQPRDMVLTKLGISDPRNHTVNNFRFLILPNVKIKNLASHVLALATKQVVFDWSWYYSIIPLMAETFVQPSLYDGTCYRAANWVEVGITKGYAKRGASYRNSQEPKIIFLYGLSKEARRELQYLEIKHGSTADSKAS